MSESGDTPAVQDNRVTDVDGDEVDDTLLNWLVFIAFHMEVERRFTDDELLVDLLLMLGYRDDEEVAALAAQSRYRTALRSALGRLGDQGARLVRDVVVEGDEALHYELTEKHVQDIREVADAIGGTVWGDAGTDEIDTYSEVAWLATMALRLEDGHFVFGVFAGGRHQLTGDELLGVLNSIWRHGDETRTRLELSRALTMLQLADYVELKKKARVVGPEEWTLTDKAWGGVCSLRDNLQRDITDPVPPVEDTPHDPQTTSHEPDASATDDLAQADREPQDAQHDNAGEQSDGSAEIESAEPENAVSQSTSAVPASISAESPHGEVTVSNIDLCKAVLESFLQHQGETLSEREIADEVAERLEIPEDYRKRPVPPWVHPEAGWLKHYSTKWLHRNDKPAEPYDDESVGDDGERSDTDPHGGHEDRRPGLYEYRLEHVFRALSIAQTGLIRDAGVDGDARESYWSSSGSLIGLVDVYKRNADAALTTIPDMLAPGDDCGAALHAYFVMHNYEGWAPEDWMEKTFSHMRGEIGPYMFELLIQDVLEKEDGVDAEAQAPNSYLDEAGVDVVVSQRIEAQGAMSPLERFSLLVQCKRHFRNEISPDAAAKLFATTMWLRGDPKFKVAGARLAFFGDLSREATWTFWALKSAWDVMEKAVRDTGSGDSGEQTRPDLTWEIWDGQRVFQLMKERRVGVNVNSSGGQETVTVDDAYFEKLRKEAVSAVEEAKRKKREADDRKKREAAAQRRPSA